MTRLGSAAVAATTTSAVNAITISITASDTTTALTAIYCDCFCLGL